MTGKKKKILVVFGTRPEAVKMLPLVARLRKNGSFIVRTAVTAQHRHMLDQVLEIFGVIPDHDLNIMLERQTLHGVASKCISGLAPVYRSEKPDLVLVHGDTATTLASALAAYYSGIEVGHVEAGLRSGNPMQPFPEEQNRRLTDALSSLHFSPTSGNRENLLREGLDAGSIFITGNTVIDALKDTAAKKLEPEQKQLKGLGGRPIVLITAHRRENWGRPLDNILGAVRRLCGKFGEYDFVYPVHPNPAVKTPARKALKGIKNIYLTPPLSYTDMVWAMKNCRICLTDSGGIQEEAPALGKPVLVMRQVTERPEAVRKGTVKLVGTDGDVIYEWVSKLLSDRRLYEKFSRAVNPYGDGRASERIIQAIRYHFRLRRKRPASWKR